MTSIDVSAKVFAMSLTSLNTTFMMYHYGSYASNPVMLRSPKPLIMRDVFLTKCTASIPNPLSCLYTTTWQDTVASTVACWFCAMPVVNIIGWRRGTLVYVGAGLLSSFAYIFQNQLNRQKRSTNFDVTCTSNGALAGLCSLSLVLPNCYIPLSKKAVAAPIFLAWWAKCLYDEYLCPTRHVSGEIQVTNWGSVGGVFFGLIFSSLFLRTKIDKKAMSTFYSNLRSK